MFLHLLVLSAAEATQLPVGVDVAILDETRQGEPELVVGDKLQTVGVLSELVVGNTTDKIQNKQRQQAVWERDCALVLVTKRNCCYLHNDEDPSTADSWSIISISALATITITITTTRACKCGGPFQVVIMFRLFGGVLGLEGTRILSFIANKLDVTRPASFSSCELEHKALISAKTWALAPKIGISFKTFHTQKVVRT